jgi:hypothetical protein
MTKAIMKPPEIVSGDLIIDPPMTECDCGWPLPAKIAGVGRVRYECPDCGVGYEARPG